MLNYFLLFLFGILSNVCLCYEIPNVKFDLLKKGFSLRIPDESGVKLVYYTIKINDKCPKIMDMLFEPQNEWITTQSDNILQPNDKLNIAILVNHLGKAYKSYQFLVVGENNTGTKVINPASKSLTKCGNTEVKMDCKEAQTIVLGMTDLCEGQLVFEENFVKTELDANKWSYDIRHRLIGKENEEFVLFDNSRENIFIRDGYLNIKPTFTQESMKDAKIDFGSRCTPVWRRNTECKLMPRPPYVYVPPVNSSQIRTYNTFEFQYGRIEVKAKLPKGDWILPYIMLQHFDTLDAEKQIRIAFVRGNDELITSDGTDVSGKILYAGIVSDTEKYKFDFHRKSLPEHFGNDYHIYTLIWKNNEITMIVDGVEYGTIRKNLDEFNKLFFITLGVSVGGHLEFPDNLQKPTNKPWTNTSPKAVRDFWHNIKNGKISWTGEETLKIDYIKVYAV